MGGTLVVGERPGGGAAFTLRLPLARAAAGRRRARRRPRRRARSPLPSWSPNRDVRRPPAARPRAPRRTALLAVLGVADLGDCLLQLWTSAVAIGPPTLLSIAAATATSSAATASTMPTYSTVPCPRSAVRIREVTGASWRRTSGELLRSARPEGGLSMDARARARAPGTGAERPPAVLRCERSRAERLADDREAGRAGAEVDDVAVVVRRGGRPERGPGRRTPMALPPVARQNVRCAGHATTTSPARGRVGRPRRPRRSDR